MPIANALADDTLFGTTKTFSGRTSCLTPPPGWFSLSVIPAIRSTGEIVRHERKANLQVS
jgi:hypothetical protein